MTANTTPATGTRVFVGNGYVPATVTSQRTDLPGFVEVTDDHFERRTRPVPAAVLKVIK